MTAQGQLMAVMESLEQALPMVEKQKNTDVLSRRKTLKNFLI